MPESVKYSIEKLVRRIELSDTSTHNKEKVLLFVKKLQNENLSRHAVVHYLRVLHSLNIFLKQKKLERASEKDLIEFFDQFKPARAIVQKQKDGSLGFKEMPTGKSFAPSSRWLYMVSTRKFYRWLLKEKTPKNCEWMRKPRGANNTPITEKDILSKAEIKEMIDAAGNTRSKAIVHCLYESGCRAAEFTGLNIGSIEPKQNYARAEISGKTGKRYVYFIHSWPILREWIECHPYKGNPQAPLWISFSPRGYGKRLHPSALGRVLKLIAKRAGIERNIFPHLLRHTSVSHRIMEDYSSEILRRMYGWTPKSNMLQAVYSHISPKSQERYIMEKSGIAEKQEKKKNQLLEPIQCPRCKTENPAGTKICRVCSLVLDSRVAMQVETEEQKWGGRLVKFFQKHPEALREIRTLED